MIVVSGVLVVPPAHHDRLVEIATTVAAASVRDEAGCRTYGVWADPAQPGRFRIFEEWDSQEALTAHFALPHFLTFATALGELEVSEMTFHRYIDPEVADLV